MPSRRLLQLKRANFVLFFWFCVPLHKFLHLPFLYVCVAIKPKRNKIQRRKYQEKEKKEIQDHCFQKKS
jgi:hypothetical protein